MGQNGKETVKFFIPGRARSPLRAALDPGSLLFNTSTLIIHKTIINKHLHINIGGCFVSVRSAGVLACGFPPRLAAKPESTGRGCPRTRSRRRLRYSAGQCRFEIGSVSKLDSGGGFLVLLHARPVPAANLEAKMMPAEQALQTPSSDGRMETVDVLRGLAALAVCLHHFIGGNWWIPSGSFARYIFEFGYYGVDVFFVISGFVIPHSLFRGGYKLVHYPRFLLKRAVRLEPPYLACIALVLLLNVAIWMKHGFDNRVLNFTWPQILLHLGYVNVFFGYPWLNSVFWTLAIEFQYYLSIGLIFPLLVHRVRWMVAAVVVLVVGVAFVTPEIPLRRLKADMIYYWSFLFLMGVAAFWQRNGFLSVKKFAALIAFLAWAHWQKHGDLPSSLFGGASALLICFASIKSRAGRFLGDISYSLYLVHAPLMTHYFGFTGKISTSPAFQLLMTLPGVLLVIWISWLCWRYIEKPSREWSARIRYQPSG
jgi:peptidoglycan/LPS O-acetylase OafA/YrhL